MIKRLAKRIAMKHIELRYPQQPLRLQPDYNERKAQDFLGERSVVMNTGYGDRIHPGPGNAFEDEIVASDKKSDLDADETESFEIIDDLDRMGDFWKESRLPSHKHNDKKTVEEAWEKHKENNPDMEKYEGAMTEDGLDEERIEENSSKSADDIIDDMGLGRMASDRYAKEHGRGSYMSRQNLREMSDMADFIVDDIGSEGLDDWVEDKVSQAYAAISDVARYRGYRDENIIDDLEY